MQNDDLILKLERLEQRIAELEAEGCRRESSIYAGIKRIIHKRLLIPAGILCFLILGTLAIGATVPNSFTAGDPISASQMNENFSYIISRLWEVTGANLHYSAGNVGIGTSNPSEKLEVIGTVDADAFTVNGTPVGTSTSSYWNQSGSDLNYTLGNIGIGTTSPADDLDVNGSLRVRSNTASFGAVDNTLVLDYWTGTDTGRIAAVGGNLSFRVGAGGATQAMWLDNTGNVGIGETAPSRKLQITNTNAVGYTTTIATASELSVANDSTVANSYSAIDLWGSHIGGLSGGSIIANVTTANGSGNLALLTRNSGTMSEKARILSNGNVGIGTTTPAYQLELSTDSAGKPTSNTWTVVSDERLKENIQPFDDGLETIMQIRPVSYELNGKANQPKGAKGISVLAQEAVDVIPYAISTFKGKLEPEDKQETELYSFNSSALTFVLINAVKELKVENDGLKKRIARLEKSKKAGRF